MCGKQIVLLKHDSHALALPCQLLLGSALPWAVGLLAVPEQLSVEHDLAGIDILRGS